jgi:hypothetical protein
LHTFNLSYNPFSRVSKHSSPIKWNLYLS